VRAAHKFEEDKQLIEAGFEYGTERDSFKIYKTQADPYQKVSVLGGDSLKSAGGGI